MDQVVAKNQSNLQNAKWNDLVVRKYEKSDLNVLNQYLKKNSNSTPYHSPIWNNIIEEEYSHKNHSLIAFQNGIICGYLPLSLMKIPLSYGVIASGLFSSHCEMLSDNQKIENKLIDFAVKLAKERNVNYLEIKNKKQLFFNNLVRNNNYVTMIFNSNVSLEQAWLSFPSYVRKQIKKSAKSNLTSVISKDNFNEFYNLLSLTMKRHGTPVHSKLFYKKILDNFEESTLVKIKLKDKIISAYLLIGYNGKLFSLAGASDTEFWKLRPNELVTWETISYAVKYQYQFVDLGRSIIDSGTYFFKKKMGAKPFELNYYYYLNNSNDIPQINQSNSKYKLATSVWKKIPVDFTKKYGHYLIRYIA